MTQASRICIASVLALGGWLFVPSADAQDAPTLALPAADKSEIESLLGPGVVIEALPSKPLAAINAYLPKSGQTQDFAVEEAGQAERQEKHHISAATQGEPPGTMNYEIAGV